MKLRPYHLLCTQGYSGKGYNDGFIENMTAVTDHLRNNTDAVVEVVFSMDDICVKCPRLLDGGLCADEDRVTRFDRKVTDYFGLEEKTYSYHDVVREINSRMTPSIMDDICCDCSWYPISACKRIILGENQSTPVSSGTNRQ